MEGSKFSVVFHEKGAQLIRLNLGWICTGDLQDGSGMQYPLLIASQKFFN